MVQPRRTEVSLAKEEGEQLPTSYCRSTVTKDAGGDCCCIFPGVSTGVSVLAEAEYGADVITSKNPQTDWAMAP